MLFTEIYLDRYFRDPGQLLSDLNAQVAAFEGSACVACFDLPKGLSRLELAG